MFLVVLGFSCIVLRCFDVLDVSLIFLVFLRCFLDCSWILQKKKGVGGAREPLGGRFRDLGKPGGELGGDLLLDRRSFSVLIFWFLELRPVLSSPVFAYSPARAGL